MKKKPSMYDPNAPDPRSGASYDKGVWRNSFGKTIGRSLHEDSEFTPVSTNPNAKQGQGINLHRTPEWVRIHNERPNPVDVRVSHSLPQTRLRSNAIRKLRANGKLS